MLSKKLVLVSAAAALTVMGVRPGAADEALFDSTSEHTTDTPGGGAAELASTADIADDGVFKLTSSASQADVSVEGDTAYTTSVVQATKYFDLEAGDYQAEVLLTGLTGTAAADRLGTSGAAYYITLDCSVCEWEGQQRVDIVNAVPTRDSVDGGRISHVVEFILREAGRVGVTVQLDSIAQTGQSVYLDNGTGGPGPASLLVAAHGGGGAVELTGRVESIDIFGDVINPQEPPAEEPPAEEPPAEEPPAEEPPAE